MSKDNVNEDLVAERTFHVSEGPGGIRTFHGLNSNVQDTVPKEFYEAAEKRKVKLIPRSDINKVKEEIKEKQRPKDDKVYSDEELKTMTIGDLTDVMLSRGQSRRDISKSVKGLKTQIKETNPFQDKVEITKEEKTK